MQNQEENKFNHSDDEQQGQHLLPGFLHPEPAEEQAAGADEILKRDEGV